MNRMLPQRVTNYVGPVTNTDVWADFTIRADDIFVCTPPKCGTTWTQTLVRMLLTGQADPAVYNNGVSPWLDCGFRDRAAQVEVLERQDHRRCIKTHTPLDGIAYDPRAVYLIVHRHPVDVHFSFRDHIMNMKEDWLSYLFEGTVSEAFRRFVDFPVTPTGTDDLTLAAIVHHFHSFRAYRDLPNLHFFHYAELSRDLPGQIRRLARILDIEVGPAALADFVAAGSFSAMKENARRQSEKPGFQSVFHDFSKFFSTGTGNKWEGRLSAAEMEHYSDRAAALLAPEERTWLETGRLPGA
ncbi:sulfotransferase domain-containing protein [Ruegeria marina]|uniref:Sulfotransferase domain-containing protein n=1 Tax=Ruegeria marina TaxID=639004 RepID=A0A1G6NQC9_9RHOB|nr:sulfotransferase domain-containing protein [Ruegeria marina]SDC69516.1 Sulfotransferase domain-containing protein [Ruegeria marina]